MRIDIPTPEIWTAVNESFRAALPFKDAIVQSYASFPHALFESTSGLARLFSHKKTVAFYGATEPAIEAISRGFSEESFVVKKLDDESDLAEQLAPLLSDLIFVVYAKDDPITGELFDVSRIESALKDKRVFRVSISHAVHASADLEKPLPFEVQLLSLRSDFALIVAGERFRILPVVSPQLSWVLGEKPIDLLTSQRSRYSRERESLIRDFESALPTGFKSYFSADSRRLFDRAVIFHPELDGSALIDLLSERLNLSAVRPGAVTQLDCTSPCRWKSQRFQDWLLARGESEEVVRGLLMIDVELIDSNLPAILAAAARDLLQKQSGG